MTYLVIGCIGIDLLAFILAVQFVAENRRLLPMVLPALLSVLIALPQIFKLLHGGSALLSNPAGVLSQILDLVISIALCATTVQLIKHFGNQTTNVTKSDIDIAALIESERKYRTAVEFAPLGMYQNTLDGKVLWINDALAKIIGAKSPESAVESIEDIATQFYVNPSERRFHLNDVLNADGYICREIEEKRIDGTVYTARSMMRAVRNDKGEPIYLEGFLEDVTDRNRTLAALKEAAAFDELTTSLLAEFASCLSADIDSYVEKALIRIAEFMDVDHGMIVLVTDDRLSYYCSHEVLGGAASKSALNTGPIPFSSLTVPTNKQALSDRPFHIDDLDPLQAGELLSQAVMENCQSSISIPILSGDNGLKGVLKLGATTPRGEWTQSDLNHLRVVAEAVANALQRARAEKALIASELNYRSLFQNAPVGIFQVSVDSKLLKMNDEVARMMRYSSAVEAVADIVDLKTQFYVVPREFEKMVKKAIAADGFHQNELQFYAKDKSVFDGDVSIRAVKNENGEIEFLEGFIRDVTETKAAAASLKRRFEIDMLITKIVADFASSEAKDVDASVQSALIGLGEKYNADQAYVFMVSPDGKTYSATHEWTADGIKPLFENYQNIPVGTNPVMEEILSSDQVINISRPGDLRLPQTANSSVAERHGRHSVLRVPVHGRAGTIAGVIGMATYNREVIWSDSDVAKLRIVGDAVAGVIERKRVEEASQRQSEYDDLIGAILARFATSGPDDIDDSVEEALKDIAACFAADNSYLTLFDDDLKSYSCTHEWVTEGYLPSKLLFQNVPIGHLPAIEDQILSDRVYIDDHSGRLISEADLADSPEPGGGDLKSVLIAPVHGVAGTIIGMVGLNTYKRSVTWTERDIAHLRLTGDAVANVIERRRAEIALKQTAAFDELIARLLAGFATSRSDEIHETIHRGIQEIATYVGAEQAQITVLSTDRACYSCLFEWCCEGIPSVKSSQQNVPMAKYKSRDSRRGNSAENFQTIEELPVQTVEEQRRHYQSFGFNSVLIVPIRNGEIIGSIGLASYTKSMTWNDIDTRQLKVVGDAIASIIDRRRAEEEVRNLNSSLEQRIIRRTSDLEEARRNAIDIMNDVDEQRRRAEEALSQLEYATEHLRLLSQAVDNSPSMVVITDFSHLIEYVNPKFTEVTGYLPEEVLGKNPLFLRSDVGSENQNEEMVNALALGKHWSGEICSRRKSGELYWEFASFAPIKGADGEVRHYVAVKQDITERKEMQDELTRSTFELTLARDAAQEANRTKSLFLANMSHEIRTPMNAILGFSQLLQNSDAFVGMHKQHLDIINRSGEHLLSLINDILEMSKIEAGRVSAHNSVVDLHALVDDLSIMFRMRCADKNIRFSVETAEEVPRYVSTDENKVRQILTNLLGNAVKLTDKGGVVLRSSVVPGDDGKKLLIAEVEDSGPGIAEDERHKVFRPFEQTTSGIRARSGTGLGLAISQQFAQMLDGEISYTSKVDFGSTFRLTMPIEEVDNVLFPVGPLRRRVVSLDPDCSVRKVLVVDDEPENRMLLTSMLTAVGFETLEATDGQAAIAAFNRWSPDVILMDAQMPGMDGYQAIRNIRSTPRGKNVPIVAVSASAFEDDRRKMLDCGADDFLAKPLRVDSVYAAIESVAGAFYRYRDDDDSLSEISNTAPTSAELREHVASLPSLIADGIREATIDADFDRVINLVDQISDLDTTVANSLRAMAEQYEAARIISLFSPDI